MDAKGDAFLETQQNLAIKLARFNVNITNITPEFVLFDYQFRMRNGQPKWAKMFYKRPVNNSSIVDMVEDILEIVRSARMEVEENEWQ